MNPMTEGIKVIGGLDLFAKGFTDTELEDVYYGLSADGEQEALLMETATLEDIDTEFNPGDIVDMLLEAVTVRKFSQTTRRMAALVRALNKNFDGIKADPAQIGKVRKSGLFASVTVQIPLSDGQVISIVFHSPDGDNTKIMPDDEIIAFRWLLNKRDITQAVSPESGREVSLEQISKRITQIAAKNSEKFQKRSKQVGKQKAALRTAKADLAMVGADRDNLMMEFSAQTEDADDMQMQIDNTQEQLDAAITRNADLQDQIDRWKAAEAEKAEQARKDEENAAIEALKKEASDLGMTDETIQTLVGDGIKVLRATVRDRQRLQKADEAAAEVKRLQNLGQEKVPGLRLGRAEEAGGTWEAYNDGIISKEDWDKYVEDLYTSGHANRPEPEPKFKPGDIVKVGSDRLKVETVGNYDAELGDRRYKARPINGGSLLTYNEKSMELDTSPEPDIEPEPEPTPERETIEEIVQKKFKSRSNASLKRSLETKKGNIDDETVEFTRRMKEKGKAWKFDKSLSKPKVIVFDEGQEPVIEPDPEPIPELEEETPVEIPPAVQTLNNIINGDLDDDPDALDRALDLAADELEEAGLMDEYDDLLNEAADHYTVVLEQLKEAA